MYEDANFKSKLENLWTAIEPIYKHLHSFVRRKLVSHYGTRRVRVDGPIPAHLLGMCHVDIYTKGIIGTIRKISKLIIKCYI